MAEETQGFALWTGRLWSEARPALEALCQERCKYLQAVDITPERTPRTPSQQFAWGQERVVRIAETESCVAVTIAREMSL